MACASHRTRSMREIYVKYQMQSLHYTVSYSYSNYSFFNVQINDIEVGKAGSKKKRTSWKKSKRLFTRSMNISGLSQKAVQEKLKDNAQTIRARRRMPEEKK